PIDKKENYIKRCIGIPGDTISITDRNVYINSKMVDLPAKSQFHYHVKTDGTGFSEAAAERLELSDIQVASPEGDFVMNMTQKSADELRTFGNVKLVEPLI